MKKQNTIRIELTQKQLNIVLQVIGRVLDNPEEIRKMLITQAVNLGHAHTVLLEADAAKELAGQPKVGIIG